MKKENGQIDGFLIENRNGNNILEPKRVDFKDFLVNNGETAIGKYGNVLKGIIKILNKQ